jgi:hypothetical protein
MYRPGTGCGEEASPWRVSFTTATLYGRVHPLPPGRGRGVTIVVYGRTEIRLERVPDKDEARGSSRRAPVVRPQLDRGRAAGLGHGRRLRAAAGAWRRFRFTRRPGYEPARRLTFRSRAGKSVFVHPELYSPQKCRRPPLGGRSTTEYPLVRTSRPRPPNRNARSNRKPTTVATVTGRTVSSPLSPRDTPDVTHPVPDGLSRAAAEAAWHAVTPLIAGTPHVRTSKDGGRTYPARWAGPLPAEPPQQPCAVAVYDPASGTGRLLALDLDPSRTGSDGDDAAAGHRRERGAAAVGRQAAELGQLLERLGGRYVADVAASGGRHVLVPFAAALPWLELRDLVRAIALRYPAVDPAPHASGLDTTTTERPVAIAS